MIADSTPGAYYMHPEVNTDRVIFLPEEVAKKHLKMFNTAVFLETPFSNNIVLVHYNEGSHQTLLDVNAGRLDPSKVLRPEQAKFPVTVIQCAVKGNSIEVCAPYQDGSYELIDMRLVENAIDAFKTIARRYHSINVDKIVLNFSGNSKHANKEWYNNLEQVKKLF